MSLGAYIAILPREVFSGTLESIRESIKGSTRNLYPRFSRELLFPPLNQVDLIFEKSGQLFYWAPKIKIWAKRRIKF